MKVTVEFSGLARVLTRTKQTTLELEEGTTFREIVKRIGQMYPDLVGQVITPEGEFIASNMLNRNGKYMIQPEQMDESPDDGDRLVMMSILAGG